LSGKADNYSDFGLYWGDLHVHSGLSSCFWLWERRGGSLDGIYCFVRDEAKLDFIAVTDHDRMSDKDWVEERVKAKEYNSPGRFVTFLAYEWSSQLPYGGIEDRNIYYLDDDMPIFRGSDWRTNNARRLFSVLEKEGIEAIVIPHHSPKVNTFTDWDQHDSRFQPVVEISSEWGNFEYFRNPHYCKGEDCWPGNFYQDLLKIDRSID